MAESSELLKSRSQIAWTELYQRYAQEIYGFVSRLVRSDSSAAEDVMQEVWLQAVRGIDNFDPNAGEIRSWLFVIARRQVALYWRRKLSPSGALLRGNQLGEITINSTLLPSDVVEQMEQSAVVNGALLSLTQERRDVLIRKYRDGWSVREIANQTGKSDKAIESLLARARNELRQLLTQYFYPQPTANRPP